MQEVTQIVKYLVRIGEKCVPYKAVLTQASYVDKVVLEMDDEMQLHPDIATATAISGTEDYLHVNTTSCQCSFWTGMQLPCRHIFALRRRLGCNEYFEELCAARWTRATLKQRHRVFMNDAPCAPLVTVTTTPRPRRVLSVRDKYSAAATVTTQLNKLLAGKVPTSEFAAHLEVLRNIADIWEKGGHVTPVEVVTSDGKMVVYII